MTNVSVKRETVINNVEVGEGNRVFKLTRSKNGVVVSLGKNSLTIPNGSIGNTVVSELGNMLGGVATEVKAKRTRRTKAQLEAARLEAEAASNENA